MAKPESVFIYVGSYPDEAAARDNYQIVMDLHSRGAVGTCGAAVVTKDSDGKVHVKPDPGPPRWRPRALKGCGTSNSKQDIELPGGWETA